MKYLGLLVFGFILIFFEFYRIKWFLACFGVTLIALVGIMAYLPSTPAECVLVACLISFLPMAIYHLKEHFKPAKDNKPKTQGKMVDNIINEYGVVKTVFRDNYLNVSFDFSFLGKNVWNCRELRSLNNEMVRVEVGDKVKVVDVKANLLIVEKV